MKKTEIILGALIIFGILLFVLNFPFGAIIAILSLVTLSGFYFYFSFALLNGVKFHEMFRKESFRGIPGVRIFATIGAGIGFSIIVLGILFKIFKWPFANQNLLIGGGITSVILVVSLIKLWLGKKEVYAGILLRSVVLGVVCCLLFLMPSSILMQLKYRDYPNYVETLKELDADPDNVLLQEKERQEYNRINGIR
ncbi:MULTISPECIES: hypothetical protein [Aquimarina]|uniref:Uncharacterized protein n=1 Tax=Aquimarina algiphila TaxID=2047982 RepID=A0A554VMK8_9FLAO|nr:MULTISPECIES: hypothetical protein [Aquimarina]TSE09535.1 hypothetical protein FOF46_08515 [Aquimarina algiphila]